MTRLLAAVLALATGRAWAIDNLMPGKVGLVKPAALVKGVFKGTFTLPDSTASPSLRVLDTLAGGGDQTFDLSTATITMLGPGGSKGVKLKGGPCSIVLVKTNVVKYVCKTGVTLTSPVTGDLAVVLSSGTTRYCALFPGATATKNTDKGFKAKDAPAPGSCAGTTTTTFGTTTTSTTTSTTIPTCTTVAGFCWFLGASGDSCDTTCTNAGMAYDAATATYAGSGGTDQNCSGVLTALGVSESFMGGADCVSLGLGCFDVPGVFSGRCTAPPTASSLGVNGYRRACACN